MSWPPCVACVGPRGVGKSTLLARLEKSLSLPNVVGLKVLRAPYPKVAPPYPGPLSLLLAAGQAMRWWQLSHGLLARYRAAGYVVGLDSFPLLEQALDPARYRYGGPLGWPEALARWLPQPEVILVLDAPEPILRARLVSTAPLAEFTRPCLAYRALPAQFRQAHLVNTATPPENTLAAIHQILHDYHRRVGR